MQKIGTIIAVLVVTVAAFAAGRMSVSYRPFGRGTIEQAYLRCVENVALEYRAKVRAEFWRAEQEWEAKHSPYRGPFHAAVYRRFERLSFEDYFERVAPTRADYQPEYIQRRDNC